MKVITLILALLKPFLNGRVHTIIPQKNGFEIMLLDINFENPMVKDSSIKANIRNGKQTIALKCEAGKDSFFCAAPQNALKKHGTLELTPNRHLADGAKVSYELPLERHQS